MHDEAFYVEDGIINKCLHYINSSNKCVRYSFTVYVVNSCLLLL